MESSTTPYRCPGEDYDISPAVHLGRLAGFYPACRTCTHRDETGTISLLQVEQLLEVDRRQQPASLFYDEGLAGVYHNQLDAAAGRAAGAALGATLKRSSQRATPTVVLASDGRPLTAELIAAADAGLRWAGCEVVDIGAATAACLAFTAWQLQAAGALLVGNPSGEPHTAGLKFWSAEARPISIGEQLRQIETLYQRGVSRAARASPSARRHQAGEAYLALLRPYFHALRPLRFVLQTTCAPIVRWLAELTRSVDVTVIEHRGPADRQLSSISRRMREEHAHFGIWIDGDGECCRIVDETGAAFDAERLLAAIALAGGPAVRTVVVEADCCDAVCQRLTPAHAVIHSGASRMEMDAALRASGARVGGGPSGRFWLDAGFCDAWSESAAADSLNCELPLADALHLLCVLLSLLSRSDRPLSSY